VPESDILDASHTARWLEFRRKKMTDKILIFGKNT
jgi:hypothetical protein